MSNYYEILEVPKDAGQEEIKQAYRKLTYKWHPDRNPDNQHAGEKFKDLVEAYAVLGDPKARKTYDFQLAMGGGDRFDPSKIDPTHINPEDLLPTFVGLFGAYLDEKIPWFRETVNKAAERSKEHKKEQKIDCQICKDKRRIELKQGKFTMYVACNACKARRAS